MCAVSSAFLAGITAGLLSVAPVATFLVLVFGFAKLLSWFFVVLVVVGLFVVLLRLVPLEYFHFDDELLTSMLRGIESL